jgi:class I fructose-bisphosphate aldolase
MYEDLREITLEAKAKGLAVVVWSYPRGSGISKEGETGIDIAAYAAQIACQLGAHIVKIKPPTAHIEQAEAKKAFEKSKIPVGTLAERVRYCVQAAFGGRRIVIFSGGPAKSNDEVLEEIRQLEQGGSFGSIVGRNAFQRSHDDGVGLLKQVMGIYKG